MVPKQSNGHGEGGGARIYHLLHGGHVQNSNFRDEAKQVGLLVGCLDGVVFYLLTEVGLLVGCLDGGVFYLLTEVGLLVGCLDGVVFFLLID